MDTSTPLYPRVREYLESRSGQLLDVHLIATALDASLDAVRSQCGALYDGGLVQRYGPNKVRWDVGAGIGEPDLKDVLGADRAAADRAEYGRFYAANPGELGEHNPTLGTREWVR